MPVFTRHLRLSTKAENEMVGMTGRVQQAVHESGLDDGVVTIFIPGSTAAVTKMEYEPGLAKDFPQMLERVAPKDIGYEHQKAWHDGNGRSHVKASLLGPSLSLPFEAGRMVLGTWQQVLFVEFDIRPRDREVVIQVMGERKARGGA